MLRYSVPRAIYYMNFWTPVVSLLKVLFSSDWKAESASNRDFKNTLASHFRGFIELLPHARICLYLILKYLNLPNGSRVLMSPINLPEMLKMIRLNSLEVDFVGYKENSFILDLENTKVNSNAKVFFYTPIAGIHTDMDALKKFCEMNDLILIQDLTQSFNARWRGNLLNTYSDYNFYSLCDLKVIHTHRGAFLQTNDLNLVDYINKIRAEWLTVPSRPYFVKFIFEDLFTSLFLRRTFFNLVGKYVVLIFSKMDGQKLERLTAGDGIRIGPFTFAKSFMSSGSSWEDNAISTDIRYRYTGLQAEIGRRRFRQFQSIDSRRIENSRLFYSLLTKKAQSLIPNFHNDSGHVFWKTPLIINDVLSFQKFMFSRGVDVARSNLPWLPDLLKVNVSGREMRENCISIPTYHYLTRDEISTIAEIVNEYSDMT